MADFDRQPEKSAIRFSSSGNSLHLGWTEGFKEVETDEYLCFAQGTFPGAHRPALNGDKGFEHAATGHNLFGVGWIEYSTTIPVTQQILIERG